MYPELFHIGPFVIHTYGVVLAVALLLVVGLARHAVRRSPPGLMPLNDAQVVDWACWTMVGGIVGGRLVYVLLNWEVYAARPVEILAIWHGGLVWYGGFAGGVLTAALYLKRQGCAFLRGADQVVPFVALGHAIGRLGCFANGCCYGKPTPAWWGVPFPGLADPRVPTQLIESVGLVGLFVLLRRIQRPPVLRRSGLVFGLYLMGYALIRGGVECWRAEQPLVWGKLTLYQLMSLGFLVLGAWVVASRLIASRQDASVSLRRRAEGNPRSS